MVLFEEYSTCGGYVIDGVVEVAHEPFHQGFRMETILSPISWNLPIT